MAKKIILLINLGSPDSLELSSVKKYLNEFLLDERVIDIPYIIRKILVSGIIVPTRAKGSLERYKSIWTENGSPLVEISKELTLLVEKETKIPSYLCMRYGNPNPKDVLRKISKEHSDLEEIVLFPLYPHYAMSSYETAVEYVKSIHKSMGYSFKLKTIPAFYNNPSYIDSLADSIKPFLEKDFDLVLFSYHGIPERHVKKADPTKSHCLMSSDCCDKASEAHKYCYRHQVIETTKLVANKLGLPNSKFQFSFQSRLGRDKWLSPYTSTLLKEFGAKAIQNLIVVCPAFVSDCLETLEEICIEGKEEFLKNGGKDFQVVPCLNTNSKWVETIKEMVTNV
ncbi:MAG: ferrochelatase [Leptospiraceae bacterium]|nr:ferrochelatase [Leptospiraceae bacterium]